MDSNDAFISAFLDACSAGDLPKAREALATGKLTAKDLDEGLINATRKAHADLVAALFDAGARISPDAVEYLPRDPIVIRHFLDHGLNPNVKMEGVPVFAWFTKPACVREFLSRGADPNLRDPDGTPPLGRAIVRLSKPDPSLLELYVEYGAELEGDLLFDAMRRRVRHAEFKVKWLLGKGIDPNSTIRQQTRGVLPRLEPISPATLVFPLYIAIASIHNPGIVKLLLDAGADPTAISINARGDPYTPVEVAESLEDPETREEILRLLKSRGG